MKKLLAVLVLGISWLAPSQALANHHACPQVTFTSKGNIDTSRKDCLPVYAPYPIGGPKSALPAGSNFQLPTSVPGCKAAGAAPIASTLPIPSLPPVTPVVPLPVLVPQGPIPIPLPPVPAPIPPIPAPPVPLPVAVPPVPPLPIPTLPPLPLHRAATIVSTVCPPGRLVNLPTVSTPYPYFTPLPGQDTPPDPLGCYGPDFSSVNKQVLAKVLGKPRNSDPPDPYRCGGGYVLPVLVGNGFTKFFRQHSRRGHHRFVLYVNGKFEGRATAG